MTESDSARSGPRLVFLKHFKKRRRSGRKPCEIGINYATREHTLEDVIKNISLGGIFIETRRPPAAGQSISMKFRLPESGKLMHASGEIVWAGLQGIGVKFSSAAATADALCFKKIREIKKAAKIKRKRIRWQLSADSDVTGIRLYWSRQGEVDYHSTYVELGNVSELVLPDDVPSFPMETGPIELGVSAINQAGNESDITRVAVYIDLDRNKVKG